LLGGAVATPSQVRDAAARGVSWPQLGLTVHEVLSPRENDLYGTAPAGSGSGSAGLLVHNSLQVFDGGLRALGALNVMPSRKISEAAVWKVNRDLDNPFYVRV
jgi:hypothetical protein